MALSPMTRVSTIRQTLEGIDSEIPWHEFWFSLDGKENLPEKSTMWDLNIFSNTMILLSELPVDLHNVINCNEMTIRESLFVSDRAPARGT
jgi:hypothetical protein